MVRLSKMLAFSTTNASFNMDLTTVLSGMEPSAIAGASMTSAGESVIIKSCESLVKAASLR